MGGGEWLQGPGAWTMMQEGELREESRVCPGWPGGPSAIREAQVTLEKGL